MKTLIHSSLLTTLILASACTGEETDLGAIELRPLTCGPFCPVSNTPFTGAFSLSALDTLGNVHKTVAVDDVVLAGGVVLDSFWAAEGQLHGVKDAALYQGEDFLGAEFQLTVQGEARSLFVSEVTPPPAGESYWLYQFDADNDGPGGNDPEPVCIPTLTGDVRAVVHDDLDIDPQTGEVSARADTVYIACLQGAAGKVAYAPLGYGFRPFELGLEAFEAAIRFVRADYCGDGVSWTVEGELITYEDMWGIGAGASGQTDAVWGMNGALCIGSELRAGFLYDDVDCPSGVKPPQCNEAQASALYDAQGHIWSKLPDALP